MRRAAALSLVGWLLLAVVLAVLARQALDACGVGWPGLSAILERCPVRREPPPTLLLDARRDEERLWQEIAKLERHLAQASDCRRPEPAAPPVVEAPEPPPAPDIPEDAWEEEDLSFLDGCWRLASDYTITNIDTHEIVGVDRWQMCFDETGAGRQTLVLENGVTCSAPVQGAFEGDQLVIDDLDEVHCSDSSYIFRREARCDRRADGTAACVLVQPDRGSVARVTIRR